MLTVAKKTNLYKGVMYLSPAVGRARYNAWHSGDVPDGPPAYAQNGPVPDISVVKQRGLFCAAVPNLILRRVGKIVPNKGDLRYDGGIAAYFFGTFGAGYYSSFDVPFDMSRALAWARETRSGVLLGKGYWGAAMASQGHTGVLLPSGFVLQSSPAGGLNWSSHIQNERGYWADHGVMVHPKNWIEYKGDEANWHRRRN